MTSGYSTASNDDAAGTRSVVPPTWTALSDDDAIEQTPAYRSALVADSLGRIVRRARIGANQTQAELAKAIDTSQPGVARLERGGNVPTIETLMKVANAVNQQLVIAILPEQTVKETIGDLIWTGEVLVSPFVVDPLEIAAQEKPEGDVDYLSGYLRED